MAITQPDILNEAIAAEGDYVVPVDTADPDVASIPLGYPPSQSTPLREGGNPVNREQTNGLFNLLSQIIVWMNAGGQFTFDAAIVAKGGYNEHAVLFDEATRRLVISLHDNNTANFVTDPTKINGTDWTWFNSVYAPQSIDGDLYTQAIMAATNTAYGGTALYSRNSGWEDLGDGNVTPFIQDILRLSTNIFSDRNNIRFYPPPGGQECVYQVDYNQISSTHFTTFESYCVGSPARMRAGFYATSNGGGGNTLSGIYVDAGYGGYLTGNLSLLDRTSPNSIAVKSDITANGVGIVASGSSGGFGYVKYAPDLTGKAWIKQWGRIIITTGITSTHQLPTAYTSLTECVINVTVANSTISSGDVCCGNFNDADHINLFCTGTGSQELYFETWGY